MTPGAGVPAAEATAAQVIRYLDENFASFATGVADARYTFWLGSGISLARVEGLKGILLRALRALGAAADASDPDCRFRQAATRILNLSGLPSARLARLDLAIDPKAWPAQDLGDILNGLAQNYAKVLDVRVDGEASDFLLWNIIDVRASYATGSITPDCEHVAVALLALEGHAPQILTANWDGLIEEAFALLGHADPTDLQVCVHKDDLVGAPAKARLIKFHGCAIRAAVDEAKYRHMLIHQQWQIVTYGNNADYKAVRTELVSQATTRPTLMIGLSAQDGDIQSVFSDASAARHWPYPGSPPAYVFAEDTLGVDQGTVLRTVYGRAFDDDPAEIESEAVIRAYAKPLLTALVLHVLCQKLQLLATRVDAPALSTGDLEKVAEKLLVLRDLATADGVSDPMARMMQVVKVVTYAMHTFRKGYPPPAGSARYWPLTGKSLQSTSDDDDIAVGGLPELALSLSLISAGAEDGTWSLALCQDQGVLKLSRSRMRSTTRIFFASTSRAAIQLEQSGCVDSAADDILVIHSDRVAPLLPRSPRSAPGRTGRHGPRHLGMAEVLEDASSLRELTVRFREEAGL